MFELAAPIMGFFSAAGAGAGAGAFSGALAFMLNPARSPASPPPNGSKGVDAGAAAAGADAAGAGAAGAGAGAGVPPTGLWCGGSLCPVCYYLLHSMDYCA